MLTLNPLLCCPLPSNEQVGMEEREFLLKQPESKFMRREGCCCRCWGKGDRREAIVFCIMEDIGRASVGGLIAISTHGL